MSTPIIPWVGGKRRLADRLIQFFPPRKCYVEVAVGDFRRSIHANRAAEVNNEINGDVTTFTNVQKPNIGGNTDFE